MKYPGKELELFAKATNWKHYFAGRLAPFVRGRVLDVGCGMGANAEFLINPQVISYTFLEPDPGLFAAIPREHVSPVLNRAERILGTTKDLGGQAFDTILYLDVIEHIEDGAAELERAASLLAPGGHLLILVPAYQFLFSRFDEELGHFRRYNKSMLRRELPKDLDHVRSKYLDSFGTFLSLGNKLLLKQQLPTEQQIEFWDRWVIPVSKVTDRLFLHSFGRSLLAVARRPE